MNVSSQGICHICDEIFDDEVLTEIDDLFLCPKDLKIYQDNEWIPYKKTVVSASNLNDALILQDLKDQLKSKGKVSFIKSTYQLDPQGEIETISNLYLTVDKSH